MKKIIFILLLILNISNANSQFVAIVQNQHTATGSPPAATTAPILSNFHITDAEPTKIYFDSDQVITATDATGFAYYENEALSGTITINTGQLTNHYLTLSAPAKWYSNPLIEYSGGNITSANGGVLKMRLQRVTNNVVLPTPLRELYVDASVGASGTGLTIGSPKKTVNEAIAISQAGDKIWIKAGVYTENVSMGTGDDGTEANPLQFAGYKTTPGDAIDLTRSISMTFDSAEMPLFTATGDAWDMQNSQYVALQNLQFEGYTLDAINLNNTSWFVFRNMYARGGTGGWEMNNNSNGVNSSWGHGRVDRCFVSNGDSVNIRMQGENCLVIDTWSVSDAIVDLDYYIAVYGTEAATGIADNTGSAVLDCYVWRFPSDTHEGHGISIKAGDVGFTIHESLVENCTLVNVGQGVELRHIEVFNNVVRGCFAEATVSNKGNLITFRDAAHDNWVEDCRQDGGLHSIRFTENDGEKGADPGGVDNTVVNFISNGPQYHVEVNKGFGNPGGNALPPTGNKFINCTFYGGTNFFTVDKDFLTTNVFQNCLIDNVPNYDGGSLGTWNATFTRDNFNGNGFANPAGTNITSLVPNFLDTTDFVPQNASIVVADAISNLDYDYNKVQRPTPSTLGAVEVP